MRVYKELDRAARAERSLLQLCRVVRERLNTVISVKIRPARTAMTQYNAQQASPPRPYGNLCVYVQVIARRLRPYSLKPPTPKLPHSLIQQPERWASVTNSALDGRHKSPASEGRSTNCTTLSTRQSRHSPPLPLENNTPPDGVRGARY